VSQAALKKIWSFFALTNLDLSFPVFPRTTGVQPGGDPLGILGFTASTIPLLALPMDMLLFGIVLWLSWVWSESVETAPGQSGSPSFASGGTTSNRDREGAGSSSAGTLLWPWLRHCS